MKKLASTLLLSVLLATAAPAAPAWTLFQLGLAGSACQAFPEETAVAGLRLNLAASRNDAVTGLDCGIVSAGGDFQALRVNLANIADYRFSGVEAGLFNRDDSLAGLSAGIFNVVDGDAAGMQIGIFNKAGIMTGMQVGLFNQAGTLHGLQIGLLNIIDDGPLTFFPVLNMAF
jgi:hypothetical protein